MSTKTRRKATPRELTNTAAAILATAIELFGSRGYHGTSVRDIAVAVGIQPGALYNHFPGKQEILYYIIEDGLRNLHGEVEAAVREADSPSSKLEAFMTLHVRYHGVNQDQTIVIDRELGALSASNRRAAVKRRTAYEKLLIDILKEGIAAGEFTKRDPRLAAYAIIGMGTEVAVWFNPAGRLELDAIERAYAEMAKALMT